MTNKRKLKELLGGNIPDPDELRQLIGDHFSNLPVKGERCLADDPDEDFLCNKFVGTCPECPWWELEG